MAEGCGASCAKFMLIVFNIVFWLSGAAIFGVGLWMRFDKNIFDLLGLVNVSESDPLIIYAAYVLIAVGAFVLVVGFLGCCGAIKENKCLLGLYIFFLFIVFAAELAAGIYLLLEKDELMKDAKSFVRDQVRSDPIREADGDYTLLGTTVNLLQNQFACCGVHNYTDYMGSNFTETTAQTFPFSCCVLKDGVELKDIKDSNVKDWDACQAMEPDAFYNKGCYDSLEAFVDQNAIILIGLGIGLACLEIFGMIFAVCLCRNVGGGEKV